MHLSYELFAIGVFTMFGVVHHACCVINVAFHPKISFPFI